MAGPAAVSPAPPGRLSLEAVGARWWAALDAAEAAVAAAGVAFRPGQLHERGVRVSAERAVTVDLLERVARTDGVEAHFSQLLVSRPHLRRLLGLPAGVEACVFNLDGVLVGSAVLHAAAWRETFDEFLLARSERTRGRFHLFDPERDPAHIHARPRLEGVREFLASRGISLPEGTPDDPPGAETVHGLANRKRLALLRRIEVQGVSAFAGSKRFLETAGDAGIGRAVVSASATTDTILERAGLTRLVDAAVDGNVIVAEELRARPAPDILLAACSRLDVEPGEAAAYETSAAGVAAARLAGFRLVVGVDASHAGHSPLSGADVVTTGLEEILDRHLPRRGR
jgi:beta-phosphoglucomutase-like phosphatase (HAD superfamily)